MPVILILVHAFESGSTSLVSCSAPGSITMLRSVRWSLNGSQLDRNRHRLDSPMRSRLIKKSLPGLPRTNERPTQEPKSRLHRSGCSPVVQTFFVILFASLGLSLTIYSGFHRFWYSRHVTATNSVLSRFTSKPPLVDRTILEKIAGLDFEHEMDSESGTDFSIPINVNSSSAFSPSFRSPRVTRIPDVPSQAPLNPEMKTKNQFCSQGNADRVSSPCKFLLPLNIAEQGPNAHAHMMQLLELARVLNRTLVLPNVGKNRVGACGRWRFGVYYDEQALSSGFDDGSGSVVQQDRFRAWADSLASPLSSQLISLNWTYRKSPPVAVGEQRNYGLDFYIQDNPDMAKMFRSQTRCLDRKFPQLDLIGTFPPLSSVVADRNEQTKVSGNISRTLLEKLSGRTLTPTQSELLTKIGGHSTNYDFDGAYVFPDVLIVSWDIPFPIFRPHLNTILQ